MGTKIDTLQLYGLSSNHIVMLNTCTDHWTCFYYISNPFCISKQHVIIIIVSGESSMIKASVEYVDH